MPLFDCINPIRSTHILNPLFLLFCFGRDMHAKVKQIDEARKDNRQYTESEGEARRQLQDLMDNFREESTRLERNWQNRRLANGNLSRNVNV